MKATVAKKEKKREGERKEKEERQAMDCLVGERKIRTVQ
jgi:hypothetical protein